MFKESKINVRWKNVFEGSTLEQHGKKTYTFKFRPLIALIVRFSGSACNSAYINFTKYQLIKRKDVNPILCVSVPSWQKNDQSLSWIVHGPIWVHVSFTHFPLGHIGTMFAGYAIDTVSSLCSRCLFYMFRSIGESTLQL
jgi:hypothetical protein